MCRRTHGGLRCLVMSNSTGLLIITCFIVSFISNIVRVLKIVLTLICTSLPMSECSFDLLSPETLNSLVTVFSFSPVNK